MVPALLAVALTLAAELRQRTAVEAYAKSTGFEIVETFYDAAVSGGDPVHERPGFAAMLARIDGNGVRAVLVETASRFARDILVQETGWRFLRERGIDLIASDSPGAFLDETPTAIMIRQLLGVISEFEKASLVAKLRGARERKKRATGKCEGRKSIAELRPDRAGGARRRRTDASRPDRAGGARPSGQLRQAVRGVSCGADAARLIANCAAMPTMTHAGRRSIVSRKALAQNRRLCVSARSRLPSQNQESPCLAMAHSSCLMSRRLPYRSFAGLVASSGLQC